MSKSSQDDGKTGLRLDRYLANNTDLSRTVAHKAIRRGWVTVNGKPARDKGLILNRKDVVLLDDLPVEPQPPRYLLLYKPSGYVCDRDNPLYPSALELLAEEGEITDLEAQQGDLHFAGRLDQDSTGLVLITDDGTWSHRVTAPKHKQPKTYHVTLARPLGPAQRESLEIGVKLKGEERPTLPAKVDVLSNQELRITIQEGRYHQVRRMVAAVGNHVERLHRESIGALSLDEDMEPGDFRVLTEAEVASFF